MLENKGKGTERFFMQYKETDWNFMKRLAGYANTMIMPEYTVPGRKVYFGCRKNKKF